MKMLMGGKNLVIQVLLMGGLTLPLRLCVWGFKSGFGVSLMGGWLGLPFGFCLWGGRGQPYHFGFGYGGLTLPLRLCVWRVKSGFGVSLMGGLGLRFGFCSWEG